MVKISFITYYNLQSCLMVTQFWLFADERWLRSFFIPAMQAGYSPIRTVYTEQLGTKVRPAALVTKRSRFERRAIRALMCLERPHQAAKHCIKQTQQFVGFFGRNIGQRRMHFGPACVLDRLE
jgi:hypothetical protein